MFDDFSPPDVTRADPDARLRMLVAIYDIAHRTTTLANALIADELLVAEEQNVSPHKASLSPTYSHVGEA